MGLIFTKEPKPITCCHVIIFISTQPETLASIFTMLPSSNHHQPWISPATTASPSPSQRLQVCTRANTAASFILTRKRIRPPPAPCENHHDSYCFATTIHRQFANAPAETRARFEPPFYHLQTSLQASSNNTTTVTNLHQIEEEEGSTSTRSLSSPKKKTKVQPWQPQLFEFSSKFGL